MRKVRFIAGSIHSITDICIFQKYFLLLEKWLNKNSSLSLIIISLSFAHGGVRLIPDIPISFFFELRIFMIHTLELFIIGHYLLSEKYLILTPKCGLFRPKNEPLEIHFRVKWRIVFSHIWMMGYFRLGYVRVNECPAGLKNWSRRVRAARRV